VDESSALTSQQLHFLGHFPLGGRKIHWLDGALRSANFHVERDTEEADTQNETVVDAATVHLGREGTENRPGRVAAPHCTASMAALSLTIVMLHERRAKQS